MILILLLTSGFVASMRAGKYPHVSKPGGSGPSLVLMSLSAHPDDEDGATLAYYGKLRGINTYSLFFTRGEGGQNEIGSQLYQDLGTLRTNETREAAKILGSEVHFAGFHDFGFSKTASETFRMWGGEDSVLARLVYYIRALKPDVVITNHDTITTKPNRAHGNHQALGISMYEAFGKAADGSFHSEQFRDGITPWQVKKLFFRHRDYVAKTDSLVVIDVSLKDDQGTAIAAIGLSALRRHRSQGLAQLSEEFQKRYSLARKYYLVRQSAPYPFDSTDLFSGIQPSPRESLRIDEPIESTPLSHPTFDISKTTAMRSKDILAGLVKTYDSTIEEVLTASGINHELVDSVELMNGVLEKCNVIILDLRAYEYRHDAVTYNSRILEYVREGGNVVCLYHKEGDWNGKNLAPYPMTLTAERVTEEDAPVTMLLQHHPLLSTPNRISALDWNGWIQERSIYLPADDTTKTSARYERILSMSDTDEHQPPTSLLWCRYGKGTYTYCSLALYRQLRIGNDGAMKLFFNMISQPRR
jgi:LmbE family N-acetylglucosaminyl deacetylase